MGSVLRHMFGLEDMKKSFLNWDAQATLLYTLAPVSGFSAGMNSVQYANISKNYKKSSKEFDSMLARQGYTLDDINEVKMALLDASPEDAGKQLKYLIGSADGGVVEVDGKPTLNEDMYQTALSFMVDAQKYNGFTQGLEYKISQYREEAQQFVDSHKNPDTNSIMFGNVQGKGKC